MERESKTAGIVAGLLIAVTGILIGWSTSQMRVPPMHAKVGPQVFPYVAAAALLIVGLCFVVQALRHRPGKLVADTDATEWGSLAFICAGFIFQIAFITTLGFILSSTVLFVAVAMGFGSRHYLRDTVVALLLSAGAYFTFTRLLNLQLPAGIFGGLV
ncbi:tripartite tricarboxylate transporter TctB family protein [Rhizobium sp.]